MSNIGTPHGFLEEGFVDFAGGTSKLVTLTTAQKPASINLTVFENQNTGAGANTETDIPARNVGNIQVASYWHPNNGKQFYIVTSAEFYGRIYYSIQS